MKWVQSSSTLKAYIDNSIIYEFHIFEFLICWNIFVYPVSIRVEPSPSFTDMHRVAKSFSHWVKYSQLGSNKGTLPPCVSFHTVNVSFTWTIQCHFCHILVLFVLILLFKIASQHGGELLSSLPKHRKAVMWLTEKIDVLDKLCSVMGYNAVGWEFSVNESAVH